MEPPDEPEEPAGLRRGYARGRAREEAIRASLVPLGEGERPGAVNAAIAVAVALGLANVALWAAGVDVDGNSPGPLGIIVFAGVMAALAYGMWQRRYGAVLAFEALLGVTIIIAALSLLVASNAAALGLCAGIVALGGWLFWKLVRAMARLQMPREPAEH